MANEHLSVVNDFLQYARTGNKSLIEKYSEQGILKALSQCAMHDKNQLWYQEMERRLLELRRKEEKRQDSKNKWKEKWADRAIGFICGVIGGLLVALLKSKLNIGS